MVGLTVSAPPVYQISNCTYSAQCLLSALNAYLHITMLPTISLHVHIRRQVLTLPVADPSCTRTLFSPFAVLLIFSIGVISIGNSLTINSFDLSYGQSAIVNSVFRHWKAFSLQLFPGNHLGIYWTGATPKGKLYQTVLTLHETYELGGCQLRKHQVGKLVKIGLLPRPRP